MKKTKYKLAAAVIVLMVFLLVSFEPLFAEDESGQGEEMGQDSVYKYPEITPQYSLWAGYWYAHLNGGAKALDYGYPDSSPAFGGSIIAFPFPYRVHAELDVLNQKDYFGDFRFAYKDLVLFRVLGTSVFHNIEHIGLVSPFGKTISNTIDLSPGDTYGLRTGISHVNLRLKYPDYPVHFYVDGMVVQSDGKIQQIFNGGHFNRVSQSRDIDWTTTDFTFGANGHLGPIEMDLSQAEKRFSAGKDWVMYYPYTGQSVPSSFQPDANGQFAHNLVPDLQGGTTSLKVHSSYTGKLVAAATFTRGDRENETSGANSDYLLGFGQVRYMPVTNLLLAVKYSYTDFNEHTPATLPAGYFNQVVPIAVQPAISSNTDRVEALAQYRVLEDLTLGTELIYKYEKRENAQDWNLPDSTTYESASLNASYRLRRNLNLRAKYTHEEYESPAYNFEPNHSDSGNIMATWTPVNRVVTFVSYEKAIENRDNLHIFDLQNNVPIANATNRNTNRDKLTGNVSFLVLDDLSLSAAYAYWRNKDVQDIAFMALPGSLPPSGFSEVDKGVKYRDVAQNCTLSTDYSPVEKLDLTAEYSYTKGKGAYYPHAAFDTSNISIAAFSAFDYTESVYSINARYNFIKKTELGLYYAYTDFSSKENPLNPEMTDGTSHAVLVSLTKRW